MSGQGPGKKNTGRTETRMSNIEACGGLMREGTKCELNVKDHKNTHRGKGTEQPSRQNDLAGDVHLSFSLVTPVLHDGQNSHGGGDGAQQPGLSCAKIGLAAAVPECPNGPQRKPALRS